MKTYLLGDLGEIAQVAEIIAERAQHMTGNAKVDIAFWMGINQHGWRLAPAKRVVLDFPELIWAMDLAFGQPTVPEDANAYAKLSQLAAEGR